ncbi:PGAP1-domain-containing protein [Tothia fuscella]|uniref:GPI inositol-deacylase n=1 Tax=Tothia fuscella TaxID=1048955 RepID=A0A9P4U2N7_9PEZI|nr:PGAP1-domain-containing protein [Tothia fuscella]
MDNKSIPNAAPSADNDDAEEDITATARRKQKSKSKSKSTNLPRKSGSSEKEMLELREVISNDAVVVEKISQRRRARMLNPWTCSWLLLGALTTAALLGLCIFQSFTTRQLDPKGAAMSYMASAFVKYPDFDTEHTRFATKYSLHLYREVGIDDGDSRVKGVPALFIPGNAGSYRQVRSLAAEAAHYWNDNIKSGTNPALQGKLSLDFFTVDFNEDITAFHGQTLLDQAEYLNDAIAYILSLYHNPDKSQRNSSLPDPSSVILVGHSMGGVVARTMLTMPNYQANSVNTIITLSAPHARAPVSFDALMINTYKEINDYWRKAHSTQWGSDNPLWHVTLISIAGGGLDTIVPSDYSSVASLIPETHGFTVFTTTIPDVWLGMDHLAITWCDQLRKAVTKALYDVQDPYRAAQTKPRGERMRSFKKWFLTGLEDVAEKTLPNKEPKTLLTLEDNSNAIISQGERLVLRSLGRSGKKKAHLLPMPPQGTQEGKKFTLLTDQYLDAPGENGTIEVLFCSVFPLQVGHSATLFSMNMDLSGDSTGSTRLACKNVASDTIRLPASTMYSRYPFDNARPFSYLQYDLEDLLEHQFVAVADKSPEPVPGWVIAEFSSGSESVIRDPVSMNGLLRSNARYKLPAKRPMLTDIKLPALSSGLLTYNLNIERPGCTDNLELFNPMVRQYISEVYESKFYVNVVDSEISLHGVAPYMPPTLKGKKKDNGLALQIWADPTCDSAIEITLGLDVLGSFGKLWMRYRTLFAALPLLVVALVLRKQFQVHDETSIFMSFTEALNQCLRGSIPILVTSLSWTAVYLASTARSSEQAMLKWTGHQLRNATEPLVDYAINDLLLGSTDPMFWFLMPIFCAISVGLCIAINYTALGITHIFTVVYSKLKSTPPKTEDGRTTTFAVTSTRQRIITTSVLLMLVSTVIPYQFAFLVLCMVQIATCVRALRMARETRSDNNYNFYNYAHSVLVLMLWILPINMPVLAVWIRNLAVHWLTPFSSHHNILSIMPYILLVETLSTGRMVPQIQSSIRYITNISLFALAVYAAIYGVSYAYRLHHAVNLFSAWLVILHWSASSFSVYRLNHLLDDAPSNEALQHTKKRP